MLVGEYAVLDGAKCIALPTKYGQKMTVKAHRGTDLVWHSYDHEGKLWFETQISLYDFSAIHTTDEEVSKRLAKLLKNAVRLNCEFLDKWNAFKIETHLDFPKHWGLGSSSTLIHLVASWADVNPLELYFKTEDGSGYDVACAGVNKPIEYICSDEEISYTPIDFNPSFKDNLFFVYSGQKQDSREAVKEYLKKVKNKNILVQGITEIAEQIQDVKSQADFNTLLNAHEVLIHQHTGFEMIKEKRFPKFEGSIKSLGAWGGDFILASSENGPAYIKSFFEEQKLTDIIAYKDMLK